MLTKSGGTGFQPVKEFRIYRRNLPHWESPGSTYFVTFRTFKGVILSEDTRDIVFHCVLYWKDKKFDLYAAVVMPDHVHLILEPLEEFSKGFFSLAEILHSIKSYSSNQINKMLKRSGPVWLDENFDRIVRDERELLEKLNYVMKNPVKAGLVGNPDDYKWLYLRGMKDDITRCHEGSSNRLRVAWSSTGFQPVGKEHSQAGCGTAGCGARGKE